LVGPRVDLGSRSSTTQRWAEQDQNSQVSVLGVRKTGCQRLGSGGRVLWLACERTYVQRAGTVEIWRQEWLVMEISIAAGGEELGREREIVVAFADR
jgi:hypothetical protein